MNPTVPLAMFGWPVLVIFFFSRYPARRAFCLSFILAWMFLPTTEFEIPGFPDYSKATAASFSVLIATMLFESRRLASFRPAMLDLPMIVWCLCPFASSMSNGLGPYDGLSTALDNTIVWGLPYLLGRIFLTKPEDLRELAILLFIGGLIYVPFCVFEMRMSPQLNQWIYGFGGAGIAYDELGKWGSRPYVFMGNGLTLGVFMTAATLCGYWLWMTGSLTRLWGYSVGMLLSILFITALMCKNMGAFSLLLAGMLCLFHVKRRRSSIVVWVLIAAAPAYMLLRGSGDWGGAAIAEIAGALHEGRGKSFQTRLDNEDRLVEKAMQQPIFGWGRWGRARVYDDSGKDITRTDGLWVIALGTTGLVGLISITTSMLVPAVAFTRRYSARTWLHPAIAPGGALALLLVLYTIDCLFNAMLNPIYLLVMGGLVSVTVGRAPVPVRMAPRARVSPRPYSVASSWQAP